MSGFGVGAAAWPGLHDRLIVYCCDAMQPLLLPGYYVEIRERVSISSSPGT